MSKEDGLIIMKDGKLYKCVPYPEGINVCTDACAFKEGGSAPWSCGLFGDRAHCGIMTDAILGSPRRLFVEIEEEKDYLGKLIEYEGHIYRAQPGTSCSQCDLTDKFACVDERLPHKGSCLDFAKSLGLEKIIWRREEEKKKES